MDLLSEEKRKQLEKMVKTSKGKAIVLVHPYYNENSLNKILATTKVPVIILEVTWRVHELRGLLMAKRAKCFILKTRPDSPVLENKEKLDDSQKDLSDLLKSVGIKKIFLGGQHTGTIYKNKNDATFNQKNHILEHEMSLRARNPTSDKSIHIIQDACVGMTYSNLIKNGGLNPRLLSRTLHPARPQYWAGIKKSIPIPKK
ncbi:MAG: hypothetical protein NTY48_02915 [Candidatus Diapherotrites archaeon]|nr:hypothetical protein [Candidatus Diapherotrites archaeon]